MAIYWPGQLVVCEVTVRGDDGLVGDPDLLHFELRKPDGVEVDYDYPGDPAIVRDSEGVYHVNITDTLMPGGYKWRWAGVGLVQGADEGGFTVRRSGTEGGEPPAAP